MPKTRMKKVWTGVVIVTFRRRSFELSLSGVMTVPPVPFV